MKRLQCVLFLPLFLLSCQNEPAKSDLEKENLKGRVWKISSTIHETGGGCLCPAAEKIECNNSVSVYNKNGNLISITGIDDEGKVALNSRFTYNRHGICKEIEIFKGTTLVSREIPVFDKALMTGLKVYDEDGNNNSASKYIYTGDKVSEEQFTDKSGNIKETFLNEYKEGQLVKQTEKDASGNIISETVYTRNNNNDISEMMVTLTGDTTMYRITFDYEYDLTGNWIKKTQMYNGEIIDIVTRDIEYIED